MNMPKRLHPLQLIQSFVRLLANNIVFIVIIFVLRTGNESTFITSIRIGFLLIIAVQFIIMIANWWKTTYVFTNDSVHQYRGVFKKRHHHMHIEQIENIQQKTPVYFRPFHVTSLVLHTRSTDSKHAITFEAVSDTEAANIRERIDSFRKGELQVEQSETFQQEDVSEEKKTIHYTSDNKTLVRASVLSLDLIIIVPIALTIFERMKDILPIEEIVDTFVAIATKSWMTIGLTGLLLIILALLIGLVKTFLTYGKYEISSDEKRIFIKSGYLNEKEMSIQKANVQAIRMYQTPLKKWLHMSEIMLVSTATDEKDGFGVLSLFPFLSTERAHTLIEELLPQFQLSKATTKLPKQALFMKMIRVPWVFLFVLAFVFTFKSSWAFILPVIFVGTYVGRYFDYRNSRYSFVDHRIHYYSGGLSSTLFTTNRKEIIEVEVTQSMIQQKLGLATIQTTNKSVPVHEESLADIDVEHAEQFIDWYGKRTNDVAKDLPSM